MEHVFILSPNNAGSTLYAKVFMRNKSVALILEGQFHYAGPSNKDVDCPHLFCEREYEFRNPENHDWRKTKEIWEHRWQREASPSKEIKYRMEKSPTFILIPDFLEKNFENARFILNIRNPYAIVGGIVTELRRQLGRWRLYRDNRHLVARAAWQAVRCLEIQMCNTKVMGPQKYLLLRYEDFCDKKAETMEKLMSFMPELDEETLKTAMCETSHWLKWGAYDSKVENMNDLSISRLTDNEIRIVSEIFGKKKSVLDHWGYELIVPPPESWGRVFLKRVFRRFLSWRQRVRYRGKEKWKRRLTSQWWRVKG